MTHAELVRCAVTWLKRCGCSVIVTEPGYCHESPDAIGWTSSRESTVVECKASRADFLKDRKKPQHTQPWRAARLMGTRRYYLAPAGMLRPEEVPGPYGLLEPNGRGGAAVVPGTPGFEFSRPPTPERLHAEMEVMRLTLRRHNHGESFSLAMASIRRIVDAGELHAVHQLAGERWEKLRCKT